MFKYKLILGIFFLKIGLLSYGQIKLYKIAKLPKKMYETSGLVFYQNKYIITINDSGNKSEIYVLNKRGEHIKTIDVEDTKNYDWEDMTQDEEGNIYIGDIGNNLNKRKKLKIYILKKGFIEKNKVVPKKITYWYEDQQEFPPKKNNLNFDSEAIFYKEGFLYILTKCRSKPFTGLSRIYKIPAKEGKHKAKLIGQFYFCSTAWHLCSVTSADYNPKTKVLSVLTYGKLYLISNFKNDRFWEGDIQVYNFYFLKQREAITYRGKRSWFLTDEYRKGLGGGNLYYMTLGGLK
ncbi:MAG TPA: hypothetical protein EYG85_09715 [Crocinitomix sp.]|nr:hypothetical protein [Crocinitomix sp.]